MVNLPEVEIELVLIMMMNPKNGLYVPLQYMRLKEFADNKKKNDNGKYTYQQEYSSIVKKDSPHTSSQRQSAVLEAKVTYCRGPLITGQLLSGSDRSGKTVEMNGKREKLKIGDIILVEHKNKVLLFIRKK